MPPGEADAGPRVSPRAPLCGEHVNAVGRNARAGHQTKVMGKRLRDGGPDRTDRRGAGRGAPPPRPHGRWAGVRRTVDHPARPGDYPGPSSLPRWRLIAISQVEAALTYTSASSAAIASLARVPSEASSASHTRAHACRGTASWAMSGERVGDLRRQVVEVVVDDHPPTPAAGLARTASPPRVRDHPHQRLAGLPDELSHPPPPGQPAATGASSPRRG